MIREVQISDAKRLADIYKYYILNTVITFEEEEIDAEEMAKRISAHPERFPYFVYEDDGQVLGYAYAGPWKGRCAYRFSAESTVYLDPDYVGKGIGKKLYMHLMETLKTRSFHAVMGGIALPNEKSIALHESLGFQKVAHFKEQGFKFDRWIDVAYWQKIL